jgi:GT2 family glycosyltransferase
LTSPRRIDVSILIVSFNTRELTLAAISSVVRETRDLNCEIIVVDNASTDGSADAIADHPSRPKLIRLSDNIGFGRGNNLAAEYATGQYVLLLNPDTVVIDRAVDRLVAFARAHPRALIWGGRTLFADGSLNPSSCWQRITPWNLAMRITGLAALFPRSALLNPEAFGGWRRDTVREVDIVSGCFFMIPRAAWLTLGGFDPTFFMYGEEADLCLRARRIGARPIVTPDATIIHHGGASEKTRAGKMKKLLAAKSTLIARHWPRGTVVVGQFLLMMWPLTRWLACSALARVKNDADAREAVVTWREVWAARRDWRSGYAGPRPFDEKQLRPVIHAVPVGGAS